MARFEKYERTNISYGCLARSLREGGFKLAIIARFSAYPSHCKSIINCLVLRMSDLLLKQCLRRCSRRGE